MTISRHRGCDLEIQLKVCRVSPGLLRDSGQSRQSKTHHELINVSLPASGIDLASTDLTTGQIVESIGRSHESRVYPCAATRTAWLDRRLDVVSRGS
eukprot:1360818-Amorphochlora_amoeboformis.AAC.2